ncbi:TFIIB-type zinc ribbon-containing protein [Ignicoccus hospitalis]|uniref:Transcription initiation factor IIB (TFIIB) n=1 Tax=Ignicoccus hospitalis (strain KIN4/I / DSM 18386 / JCM 14125) TaxID=453591 RepID=A8AAK0_IGNH4|nr:TFIIB-type zinc ribbon-containing protein [Ignicoccus hospitalis]ABU81952.1 Transcription initiation factor IIB (TFIIB) [Ignicoccus hospitalis KIN4/I]HIH89889.1 transcription initiation factor IIB family protein [Desulfurococcaceae archaeon]
MSAIAGGGTLKCPVCGSTYVVQNEMGDLVCASCGTVLQESREVSFDSFEGYGSDNKPIVSRGALTVSLHDKGLGSVIDIKDIHNFRFKKMAKLHSRLKIGDDKESFIADVKKGIEEYSSLIARTFGTPLGKQIVANAHAVSDKIYDLLPKEYRKKDIEYRRKVGLAIILAVIKECGSYIPPEVVLNKLGLDSEEQKTVKELYVLVHDAIVHGGTKGSKEKVLKCNTTTREKLTKVTEALLNFLELHSGLQLPRKTLALETIHKISNAFIKAKKDSLGSKYISSYVGGAIYLTLRILAIDQKSMLTQEEIAKALGRGSNAIRNAYTEIVDNVLVIVEVPAKPAKNKSRKSGKADGSRR